MSFLLDTNIVSSYLKRPAGLNHRFIQYSGRLSISTISLAELYVWAYQREKPERALAAINDLLHQHLEVRPFDRTSAVRFGLIRNELKPLGIVLPQVDLLLAARPSLTTTRLSLTTRRISIAFPVCESKIG